MVAIATCTECDGTKNVPHNRANETVTCFSCNGWGKTNPNHGSAYKSQAMADRYGKVCRTCNGNRYYTFPATTMCLSCYDTDGKEITEIKPGEILPDVIGRCSSIPRDLMDNLITEMEFSVIRTGQGLNWGESYLGIGAVYTCTDYGTAWGMSDEKVIAKVKEGISSHLNQWINFMDSDRVVNGAAVIKLTPNGFSVITVGSLSHKPMLPPTYTDSVLKAKI